MYRINKAKYPQKLNESGEVKKQTAEALRRLVNTNFKSESIKTKISYISNAQTSLLTVSK